MQTVFHVFVNIFQVCLYGVVALLASQVSKWLWCFFKRCTKLPNWPSYFHDTAIFRVSRILFKRHGNVFHFCLLKRKQFTKIRVAFSSATPICAVGLSKKNSNGKKVKDVKMLERTRKVWYSMRYVKKEKVKREEHVLFFEKPQNPNMSNEKGNFPNQMETNWKSKSIHNFEKGCFFFSKKSFLERVKHMF